MNNEDSSAFLCPSEDIESFKTIRLQISQNFSNVRPLWGGLCSITFQRSFLAENLLSR